MPWFKCLIHGENFPGILIGEVREVGFYTTRFVEAPNPEQAEILALARIRDEPKLQKTKDLIPGERAKVYFDEIEEVPREDVPEIQEGFSWYIEGT